MLSVWADMGLAHGPVGQARRRGGQAPVVAGSGLLDGGRDGFAAPPVGVKVSATVPESCAVGAGAVTLPGNRRSMMTVMLAVAGFPSAACAVNVTRYVPSGACSPPELVPSQTTFHEQADGKDREVAGLATTAPVS